MSKTKHCNFRLPEHILKKVADYREKYNLKTDTDAVIQMIDLTVVPAYRQQLKQETNEEDTRNLQKNLCKFVVDVNMPKDLVKCDKKKAWVDATKCRYCEYHPAKERRPTGDFMTQSELDEMRGR